MNNNQMTQGRHRMKRIKNTIYERKPIDMLRLYVTDEESLHVKPENDNPSEFQSKGYKFLKEIKFGEDKTSGYKMCKRNVLSYKSRQGDGLMREEEYVNKLRHRETHKMLSDAEMKQEVLRMNDFVLHKKGKEVCLFGHATTNSKITRNNVKINYSDGNDINVKRIPRQDSLGPEDFFSMKVGGFFDHRDDYEPIKHKKYNSLRLRDDDEEESHRIDQNIRRVSKFVDMKFEGAYTRDMEWNYTTESRYNGQNYVTEGIHLQNRKQVEGGWRGRASSYNNVAYDFRMRSRNIPVGGNSFVNRNYPKPPPFYPHTHVNDLLGVTSNRYYVRLRDEALYFIYKAYNMMDTILYTTFLSKLSEFNLINILFGYKIFKSYVECPAVERVSPDLLYLVSCLIASKYLDDKHMINSWVPEKLVVLNKLEIKILSSLKYAIDLNVYNVYDLMDEIFPR